MLCLIKIISLKIFDFKFVLLLVILLSASEKRHSEGTQVAGIDK